MALCLAESLVRKEHFDPADQMRRYTNWYEVGYMSSTGTCFDIGGATRNALERFRKTGEPYSGSTDPMTAGNGSIMRLAPVAMVYAGHPQDAVHYAKLSSRTTRSSGKRGSLRGACGYSGCRAARSRQTHHAAA